MTRKSDPTRNQRAQLRLTQANMNAIRRIAPEQPFSETARQLIELGLVVQQGGLTDLVTAAKRSRRVLVNEVASLSTVTPTQLEPLNDATLRQLRDNLTERGYRPDPKAEQLPGDPDLEAFPVPDVFDRSGG